MCIGESGREEREIERDRETDRQTDRQNDPHILGYLYSRIKPQCSPCCIQFAYISPDQILKLVVKKVRNFYVSLILYNDLVCRRIQNKIEGQRHTDK